MGEGLSGRGPGTRVPSEVGRPTEPQRRYLERGLTEPGGKLPLFDRDGRQVPRKTVEACIAHGWAEPWTHNPIKSDWLVCKLTPVGHRVLGVALPGGADAQEQSKR
jgi:hypothetical protein